MKPCLSLRLDFESGRDQPLQYSVMGLAKEDVALISRDEGGWTLFRLGVERSCAARVEGFPTPEDALAFLQQRQP
jgi:hypothetical protein